MVTQKVTVELPEPVFRQLVRIAEATDQPLFSAICPEYCQQLATFC